MKQHRKSRDRRVAPGRRVRAGFTLVEMLVSTALIVLVMLMFAQVYQVAASSVGTQKGIVENDQRSRTLTTIIKNDIDARTFRFVLPVHPALEPGMTIHNSSERAGYFYISENDTISNPTGAHDADDVLQFTVNLGGANVSGAGDNQPLSGRAIKYGQPPLVDPVVPLANYEDQNQPEGDDGQIDFSATPIINNQTGSSPYAEISYFLRNGNLIRRVMLIRNKYSDNPASPPLSPAQPPSFPATDYPAGSSFWNDFDYSAHYLPGSGPQFHSVGIDLDNETPASLGFPRSRFGHDHLSGNPREYVNQPTPAFIGRFTQQETSDPIFGYPGTLNDLDGVAGTESPLDPATNLGMFNGGVTYSPGGNGIWDSLDDLQFQGPRRGEDILMTHVHSFDVKVFDQAYDETGIGSDLNQNGKIDAPVDGGAFADVGHAAAGDYAYSANRCPGYGPQTPGVGADGFPGNAGDDNLDGTPEGNAELGWPGSDDTGPFNRIFDTWHHVLDFDEADGGVPGGNDPPPYWAPGGTTIWAAAGVYAVDDFVVPTNANWTGFVYRCVTAGASGGAEPAWPTVPGTTVVDGAVTWRCESLRPLRAIQITIRFFDVASGQMRQLTLVESLVD